MDREILPPGFEATEVARHDVEALGKYFPRPPTALSQLDDA